MQRDLIADAIKSIGWDATTGAPIANAENMQLLTTMTELMDEKTRLGSVLQTHAERAEKIINHENNAKLNIANNLKLLNAYQCEIRTESHLYKLAERENSKLKQELKRLQQEFENLKKYEAATDDELNRRKSAIDAMTARISWAKTALDEWHLAIDSSNEANEMIKKYCKEDQVNLYRLDVKRKAVQNDVNKNRKLLIDLYEEQKSLENNLDRTGNLYRLGHTERRQLVDTWKSAVNQMTQREQDIENAEKELEKLKITYDNKKMIFDEYSAKLNSIQENNRETEESIEELNEETSEIREEVQRISDLIILKDRDVDILTKELQNLDHFVKQQRFENRGKVQEISDKENDITNFEEVYKNLQERYNRLANKNFSAQERLQVLEDMIDSEERTKLRLSKDAENINSLLFRSQQQLQNYKNENKVKNIEIASMKSETASLERSKKQMSKELARQNEIYYELAMKAMLLDSRIGKMRGSTINPIEEEKKLAYLKELQGTYDETSKKFQILQVQSARLDDNLKKLTTFIINDDKVLENLNTKMKESHIYHEMGTKQIKTTTQDNQEKIVELSILKMRVNDLENQLERCETKSYNLDKHRELLKSVVKQRMRTVSNQMDLLNQKKKHMLEEFNTLKADIGERTLRKNAAMARYELTVKLLGVNDDGTMVTSTQMKIESAQERQLLLDEGNTLNESVLRAENEIKAMEKTLCLLNSSNDTYRKAFQIAEIDGDGMAEITELQTKYCNALARLKSTRLTLIQEDQNNEELRKQKKILENDMELESQKGMENNEILTKIQKDLHDQRTKIQRAEREVKSAFKTLQQKPICSEYLKLIEMDINLRELNLRNASAIKQLQSLTETGDMMAQKLCRSMCNKGMKFPQLLKSQSSVSLFSGMTDVSRTSSRNLLKTSSRSSLSDNIPEKGSARASVVSISFPSTKDLSKK